MVFTVWYGRHGSSSYGVNSDADVSAGLIEVTVIYPYNGVHNNYCYLLKVSELPPAF